MQSERRDDGRFFPFSHLDVEYFATLIETRSRVTKLKDFFFYINAQDMAICRVKVSAE